MNKIFFIDPQTLSMYDYELLSRMGDNNIYLFGNKKYNYLPMNNIICKFWFRYTYYNNNLIKGISYILTMLRIAIFIIFNKPKVIHIQWVRIPTFDYYFYSVIRYCFKSKIVYTVHNILPHTIKKRDFKHYKRFYSMSDALIVHTNTCKQELSKDFGINTKKIFIAPMGPYKSNENEEDLNYEVGKINNIYNLNNKIIFSILGVQSEYKGTDLLIEAWLGSEELKNNTEISLIVAGLNTNKFIVQSNLYNIVAIDGHLSNLTFNALIRRSNVIVLPYRRIEQSGVLLSLISEHVPYCATNVGELTEPILNENIGWIIPEISIESIRETLELIVRNMNQIIEKAENELAWNRICSSYDWENSARITQNIYNNLG